MGKGGGDGVNPSPETPASKVARWPTPALGTWDLGRLRMLEGEHVRTRPRHAGHPRGGGWGLRDPIPGRWQHPDSSRRGARSAVLLGRGGWGPASA